MLLSECYKRTVPTRFMAVQLLALNTRLSSHKFTIPQFKTTLTWTETGAEQNISFSNKFLLGFSDIHFHSLTRWCFRGFYSLHNSGFIQNQKRKKSNFMQSLWTPHTNYLTPLSQRLQVIAVNANMLAINQIRELMGFEST